MVARSFSVSNYAAATTPVSPTREPPTRFNYDALEPKNRRKSPKTTIASEDAYLGAGKRGKLQANAADIARNFSVVAWAIRRHLDYVARFDFHSRTGDRELDRTIEALMAQQSIAMNFDRGGRASRERAFRMAESRRIVDGDTGVLLLQSGHVQGIEADLIRNPAKPSAPKGMAWVDGVLVDYAGRPARFALWGRGEGGKGYVFQRIVSAENLLFYGCWERWASEQIRGVSPLVTSLNQFRDVYEGFDYALAKMKLSQLFAIAMTRDADQTSLASILPGPNPVDEDEDGQVDDSGVPPRQIDLTHGPTVFDLDPGEEAKILESQTPSNELQQFSRLILMVALKALDIPYSFFDEAHTNYSGHRGSWIHYERSTLAAREDQLNMRIAWTRFQLARWIFDSKLVLPRGMTLDDLAFEWVPLGMPWWDPLKEINGDLLAISAGLDSCQRVTKERGRGDIFDNIDDNLEVIKYAHDRGMEVLGVPYRLNFQASKLNGAELEDGSPPAKKGTEDE